MAEEDSRYPYTYACDLIRSTVPMTPKGASLSRGDASQIRKLFSEVLELDDEYVAKKLADYFKKNEQTLTQKSIEELHRMIREGHV